jgi:hypothetical protein
MPMALIRLLVAIHANDVLVFERNELSSGWSALTPRQILPSGYLDPRDAHASKCISVAISRDTARLPWIAFDLRSMRHGFPFPHPSIQSSQDGTYHQVIAL